MAYDYFWSFGARLCHVRRRRVEWRRARERSARGGLTSFLRQRRPIKHIYARSGAAPEARTSCGDYEETAAAAAADTSSRPSV